MEKDFSKKNEKGLTLIEMVVAISIFTTVVLMSAHVFTTILSGQRRSISQQNTQENMRYLYEIMSKEIRQAQRSDDDCYSAVIVDKKKTFNTSDGESRLHFENKNEECVTYFLSEGVLMVRRGAMVASTTPKYLEISGLEFDVTDNNIAPGANPRVQPRVTFKMIATTRSGGPDTVVLKMQTTVSSRYYE